MADVYPLSHTSLVEAATRDAEVALILVMGESRSGKTKLVNLLSRSNFATGKGCRSCTNTIQLSRIFEHEDKKVMLIDTPGLEHHTRGESDILGEVASLLADIHKKGMKLQGMIYVQALHKNCMSATAMRAFTLCASLFGDAAIKHIIIASTIVDRMGDGIRAKLEARLTGPTWGLKPFLNKGIAFRSHVNLESGRNILEHVLDEEPAVLLVQVEMCDEHKEFHETTIGKLLVYGTEGEILYTHEKEMRSLSGENAKLRAELIHHQWGWGPFGHPFIPSTYRPIPYPIPSQKLLTYPSSSSLTVCNPYGDCVSVGNPTVIHGPLPKCRHCIANMYPSLVPNNWDLFSLPPREREHQFCGQCSSARVQHIYPPSPSSHTAFTHSHSHVVDVDDYLSQ